VVILTKKWLLRAALRCGVGFAGAALVSGCGAGGAHQSALPGLGSPSSPNAGAGAGAGAEAAATFTITIPAPGSPNASAIVSTFANDPTAGVMAWDAGRQSLIYVN
jgi:hypothetical protein